MGGVRLVDGWQTLPQMFGLCEFRVNLQNQQVNLAIAVADEEMRSTSRLCQHLGDSDLLAVDIQFAASAANWMT